MSMQCASSLTDNFNSCFILAMSLQVLLLVHKLCCIKADKNINNYQLSELDSDLILTECSLYSFTVLFDSTVTRHKSKILWLPLITLTLHTKVRFETG